MSRTIRTAGYALALVFFSLSVFAAANAQTAPHKYGFCQGLAGNPRVNNFTRLFVLGPSGSMSGFLQYLHQKYAGYTTQEIGCRTFATAAEAETEYRKELAANAPFAATWPLVEIDWMPEGGSVVSDSGLAAAPAQAAAPKPSAPAPAAAPAASTAVQLDRWGKPIPTSAWWFCNSYVNKNSYASAPFVAGTLDGSPTQMFQQFLDYLNKKYHQGGTATCNKFTTQAEAEQRIAQLSAEAPGQGRQFDMIDWTFKPGASAAAAPAPVAAKPVSPAPAPKPAPAVVAAKPASPATAKLSTPATPSKPAVYVICRSESNRDLRRFFNPPVDGRGAGYPEWQASYQAHLVKQHGSKGSNSGCGKYPTKEAAQADYDTWVANARATPTVNGQNSPIVITDWKY